MTTNISRVGVHVNWRSQFLFALVARDLSARYKSSIFGWLWPVIVQVAQLLIFTYLFAAIFKVRLQVTGIGNSTISYGLWLFTGLVAWNCFQASIMTAASSVMSAPNLVKKVVFPLALLPLVPVCSSMVEALAGFVVLFALTAVAAHILHPTILLVPLVILIQLMLTAGIAYLVAGLTVFIRDIPQMLGPLLLFSFYLTPIVYPPTSVPHAVARFVAFNPFGVLVDAYRQLILAGTLPSGRAMLYVALFSAIVFYAGWRFYRRVRPIFADIV